MTMRAGRTRVAAILLLGALLALSAVSVLGGPAARAAVPLEVTSSVTPSPVIIGDTATYTVTVRNSGSTAAANVRTVVTITPDGSVPIGALPADCTASGQVITCTAASLDAGGTVSYQIPVTVSPSLSDGTNLRLEATARDSSGATGSAQPLITQARTRTDVEITKTGPAEVGPGGTITYTITVTNHGPSDAVSVTWHDETNGNLTSVAGYPCGNTGLTVSCTTGTLTPGETRTYTITLTARPDLPDGTLIPNCAVVYTGTSPDTNLDNNRSCVNTVVTVPSQPAPTPPPSPTLDVTKMSPVEVYEKGTITYTITVTNHGPGDATDVRVSDPLDAALDLATLKLPGECTLHDNTVVCQAGTLGVDDSKTFEVSAKVRDDVGAGTNVINCAVAISPDVLVRVASASSCAQTQVVARVSTLPIPVTPPSTTPTPTTPPSITPTPVTPPSANVSVAKTAPARVGLDGTIAYTLDVTNHGPDNAADVVVHDPVSESLVTVTSLPGDCALTDATVTCQAGTLRPGETRSFTITVRVNRGVGDRTVIENCADAYAATDDPDIGDNQSCAQTIVGKGSPPRASLVTVKDGPRTARPGGAVTYTVTVTNHGPGAAADVIVADPLDEPLITPASLPPGCAAEAGTVTCAVGTIPAGESRTLRFTVTARAGLPQGTRIDNCATALSSTTLLGGGTRSSCTEADISGQEAPSPPTVPVTG